MAHRSWNESYAAGELPWDTREPEPLLVEFVTAGRIRPTRTLEIGAASILLGAPLAVALNAGACTALVAVVAAKLPRFRAS